MAAAPGMKDDTLGPIDHLDGETIKAELAEISKYKIHRNSGYHWVTHQLKVLVSDEDEEEEEEEEDGGEGVEDLPYNPDDPDDMERFAIALSLQTDEEPSSKKQSTHYTEQDSASPFGKEVADCPRCCAYPRFSKRKRTRKYRLVQPWEYVNPGDEVDMCDHFMAVSYCWSGSQESPRTSVIRDCTGERRDVPREGGEENIYLSKAGGRVPPDEILDRAVEYAAEQGLRCIWIDQACLPQDASTEHQTGIQSMDMVYQRASRTAGILDSSHDSTTIASQSTLETMAFILAWYESGRATGETPGQDFWNLHYVPPYAGVGEWGLYDVEVPLSVQRWMAKTACHTVLGFLGVLAGDRWYSRAWILQEALSSGPKLALLFRVPSTLSYNPSPFVERRGRMLEGGLGPAGDYQTFVLELNELQALIKGVRRMIDELFDPLPDHTALIGQRQPYYGEDTDTLTKARKILDSDHLQRLHPVHRQCAAINCSCGTFFTCNAAAAVTLLQGRQCLKAEDKIAIVANLCNYEVRLDVFQLAKRSRSLRICILALAILNGDLSLLVRDHYDMDMSYIDVPDLPLLELPVNLLHKLKKLDVEADSTARFQTINSQLLRPSGIGVPAYLWRVDRELDLTRIRDRWRDMWWDMKCLHMEFFVLPDDSVSDFEGRPRKVQERLDASGRAEMYRIREKLRGIEEEEGRIGTWYQDKDFPGVRFTMRVSSLMMKNNKDCRNTVGRALVDLFSYLCYRREAGLATSIWQSLRLPDHKQFVEAHNKPIPDHVGEELLSHPIMVNEPGRLLQFDGNSEQNVVQQWLFDRVFMRGKLWVGQYVPSNTAGSASATLQPLSAVSNDIYGPTRIYKDSMPPTIDRGHDTAGHTLQTVHQFLDETDDSYLRSQLEWATEPMSIDKSTILGRATVKQLLANEMTHQWKSPESSHEAGHRPNMLQSAAFGGMHTSSAMLHFMETYVGWDIWQQDLRNAERVSAFDVDCPCLVATAYDASREKLPHPEERSMRAAWVVTRQGMEMDEEEEDWVKREFVRLRRLLLGGGGGGDQEVSELEMRYVPEKAVEDMKAVRLKVDRSVKGVWEVMDPIPFQSFTFM